MNIDSIKSKSNPSKSDMCDVIINEVAGVCFTKVYRVHAVMWVSGRKPCPCFLPDSCKRGRGQPSLEEDISDLGSRHQTVHVTVRLAEEFIVLGFVRRRHHPLHRTDFWQPLCLFHGCQWAFTQPVTVTCRQAKLKIHLPSQHLSCSFGKHTALASLKSF